MEALRYLDFDVQLEHEADRYVSQVLRSPAGEASGHFQLPFTEDRLENLVLKMGPLRARARGLTVEGQQAARELGAGLFESIFSGEVLACLRTSLDTAGQQEGVGLRVKLRLQNTPELADLPWEFLFDKALNRFLAQSSYTPIVRYMEMPERIRPLSIELPLRILVMASSPEDPDFPRLDIESEKAMLAEALAPLINANSVIVDWLEKATLSELQAQLRRRQYHVFHYIGHGGFDAGSGTGVLVLEDEQGRSRWAPAHRIGPLLHDHRSLRLLVLNSCEGARNSRTDPFAGMAASIIQQGIPAVVAMQFEITDRAAIIFGSEFYAALVAGLPVDAAVAEARKAILVQANEIEWGTPVLYMRSADGALFDVTEPPVLPVPTPTATPDVPVATASFAPAATTPGNAPSAPDATRDAGPLVAVETAPPAGALELELEKQDNGPGKAVFNLVLTNETLEDLDVSLDAELDDDSWSVMLPERVTVGATSETHVKVEARRRGRRWRGGRESRSLTVSAGGDGSGPPRTVRGEFDDLPQGPLLPLAGGGFLAIAAALAGVVLLGGAAAPPENYVAVNRLVFTSDRDGHEEIYAADEDGSNLARLTNSAWPNRLAHADAGSIVFISERDGGEEIYIMNDDGTEQTRISTTDGEKLEPRLSPYGDELAFEVKRGDSFEIYAMSRDGTALRNLTNNLAMDIDPNWSPDAEKIAFASNRAGNQEIYVMEPDGSNVVRLTSNPAFDAEPAWSPDGEKIAFQSNRAGSFDLYIMNAADGFNLMQLTRDAGDEFDPAWSPDGTQIAYTSARDGRAEIYLINVDGSNARNFSNHPANDVKPSWFEFYRLGP